MGITEKDLLRIFKRNKRRLGGTPKPKGGVKGIGEAIVETLTRSVQTDDRYERSRRILEKAKSRLELITEGMRTDDYLQIASQDFEKAIAHILREQERMRHFIGQIKGRKSAERKALELLTDGEHEDLLPEHREELLNLIPTDLWAELHFSTYKLGPTVGDIIKVVDTAWRLKKIDIFITKEREKTIAGIEAAGVRVYGYITVATKEQGTFHFVITEKTGHLPRAFLSRIKKNLMGYFARIGATRHISIKWFINRSCQTDRTLKILDKRLRQGQYDVVIVDGQALEEFSRVLKENGYDIAGYVNLEGEGRTLTAVVVVGDLKYLETGIKFFRVKRGLWRLVRARKFVQRFKLQSVEIVVKR